MAQVVEHQIQSQARHAENSTISITDQERGDPQGEKQLKKETGMSRHFRVEISTQNADVLMLTCCLISGLMDSTIYDGMISCHSYPPTF